MSTYSNLKVELMVTGENATTWGNVTNTNLGQALEQAIVRQIDIVFADVNYTVPAVADNNGAQEARNLRLNLTGTATTPLNLIVPPFVGGKPYIVNNTTASTITVKNTTGTGIAVPAGKTMWVYNNGTNVVDAVTHLTSLTLATALPAASGGTGVNSPGTAGNVLTSNGTAWVSQAGSGGGGTVTSVNATTAISGLSFSGGPVTASGTLTLSGTLGAAGGGTGLVSAGTAGNVLTSNGTAWVSQAGGGSSGVSSFNTRTGAVTLSSSDVTGALGYTPVQSNGTGATGTWGISISGNAASATSASSATSATTAGTATTATTANALNTANNYQVNSLGVGTAGSGTAGEIRATNNVTAFYSSDARLKENVHPIQNALGIVSSVGGKTFDWTDAYIADHGGADGYFVRKNDFGVIAQDVQAVFPVAVRERGDGTLAVDYEKLVAVAFAAIAELKAEVEALKK
jgi:hypothetical protein